MRARSVIAAAATVAAVFAIGVDVSPPDTSRAEPAVAGLECAGRAFPWDGRCWRPSDGRAFARWLARHGSSARAFERNHPDLAATFREPWPPPPPYWRVCDDGYRCARAVIVRYFPTQVAYALGIVRCETGGTFSQHVVGDAGELSVWQIHPTHFGWVNEGRLVADIRYATSVAYRLSEGGRDWSPWTCA